MRILVIIGFLGLTGCASQSQNAEQKYAIVEQSGDIGMARYQALCSQATAVAAAYLNEQNNEKYREWNRRADRDCTEAKNPYAR